MAYQSNVLNLLSILPDHPGSLDNKLCNEVLSELATRLPKSRDVLQREKWLKIAQKYYTSMGKLFNKTSFINRNDDVVFQNLIEDLYRNNYTLHNLINDLRAENDESGKQVANKLEQVLSD